MGWRTAIDWLAFAMQDLGACMKNAGDRLEAWNAPRRRVLGFLASTWQDNKQRRHLIKDSNDEVALCGLHGGPFGWENLNPFHDADLWGRGVCVACLRLVPGKA